MPKKTRRSKPSRRTVSRNSPVPRRSRAKREITQEQIAVRAFEIYVSGQGGSESDNWFRAERELRNA